MSNVAGPRRSRQSDYRDAIAALAERGAHLVLCRESKAPLWRGWQNRRPTLDQALAHDRDVGPLAVIPWSLHSSVIDVDEGDASALTDRWPPLAAIPSRREGGLHLWFRDVAPRRNSRLETHGVQADVRGGSGFLILWNAAQVARALENPPARAVNFPLELLVRDKPSSPEAPPAARDKRPRAAALPRVRLDRASALGVNLEGVPVGRRAEVLFDVVRHLSYDLKCPPTLAAWVSQVGALAAQLNTRFETPLEDHEVLSCASSIAEWTRVHAVALDHGPEAQSRRWLKSARVRGERLAARNQEIVEARGAGDSVGRIAARHEISERQVRRVLASRG